jgi:hypothetical protein
MNAHGFDAVGYDPSPGLLAQARARHPGLRFLPSALPELDGIESNAFRNALRETVISTPAVATRCSSTKKTSVFPPESARTGSSYAKKRPVPDGLRSGDRANVV